MGQYLPALHLLQLSALGNSTVLRSLPYFRRGMKILTITEVVEGYLCSVASILLGNPNNLR